MKSMRVLFLGAAVMLFVIAIAMGTTSEAFRTVGTANAPQVTPNIMAGLASFGFSVAGGLTLLAAAVERSHNHE